MRPQRIILLRHGQAEGNVDETIFERKPDHRLELTPKGVGESIAAGKELATLLAGEPVAVYVSPYVRTWQTYEALRDAIHVTQVREEPRLREQDWGNYQDGARIATQKAERDTFGHFFYRFERGESGSDVYDRVSTFFETLHRDFHSDDFPPNALLITHGLTMRLFLMRWFHWTVPYFESLENPRNCERRVLQRGPDGRYTLDEPLPRWK